MRTTSSNLGTPSQPSVGMANPAEIDGLGGTEPTKRKSKCARLGYFHSQPPAAVLNRHGRHGAIRLIPFFVHVSPAEGYGGLRPGRRTRCRRERRRGGAIRLVPGGSGRCSPGRSGIGQETLRGRLRCRERSVV